MSFTLPRAVEYTNLGDLFQSLASKSSSGSKSNPITINDIDNDNHVFNAEINSQPAAGPRASSNTDRSYITSTNIINHGRTRKQCNGSMTTKNTPSSISNFLKRRGDEATATGLRTPPLLESRGLPSLPPSKKRSYQGAVDDGSEVQRGATPSKRCKLTTAALHEHTRPTSGISGQEEKQSVSSDLGACDPDNDSSSDFDEGSSEVFETAPMTPNLYRHFNFFLPKPAEEPTITLTTNEATGETRTFPQRLLSKYACWKPLLANWNRREATGRKKLNIILRPPPLLESTIDNILAYLSANETLPPHLDTASYQQWSPATRYSFWQQLWDLYREALKWGIPKLQKDIILSFRSAIDEVANSGELDYHPVDLADAFHLWTFAAKYCYMWNDKTGASFERSFKILGGYELLVLSAGMDRTPHHPDNILPRIECFDRGEGNEFSAFVDGFLIAHFRMQALGRWAERDSGLLGYDLRGRPVRE